ncbi:MAG: TraR/DksA family transcriptional regulator, partial [Myxococcales bacterium]
GTAGDPEALARLREVERRELHDIERALERIAVGTYGRCEACDGAIGRHRLLALPEARYCVDCTPTAPRPSA